MGRASPMSILTTFSSAFGGGKNRAAVRLVELFVTKTTLNVQSYIGCIMLGAGLGLSISRKLVEAMGGKISASNLPEGGLEVSFTLPAG